jgi:pyruvate/2-oxoglutarate dehydrogenase complex dihydrolipoamide acyltransferase (E2) component
MRVSVVMPKVSYEMEFGIVQAWRKTVGDAVAQGEVIAEIETEKASVELEATAAGTLDEIVHDAGAEVPVLEPIAWIETGA